MSIFGAMNTAVSGLSAQSAAFSTISDNVANSQTVGFKRADTSFQDYLTSSSASFVAGGVLAGQDDMTEVQGTITQSDDRTAMAVSGRGFFAVNRADPGASGAASAFDGETLFTRAGDFRMDHDGYLVNGAGSALDGWAVDASGVVQRDTPLSPVRVAQMTMPPQATGTVTISANLPSAPASGAAYTSLVDVYDGTGAQRQVKLDWTRGAAVGGNPSWDLTATAPDGTASNIRLVFGSDGILSGSVPPSAAATGGVTLAVGGITLGLGTVGRTDGVTQFAGSDYTLHGAVADGYPAGGLAGVNVTAAGDVMATYDNGQSVRVAHVPLVTFANPDALQHQDGQAFRATVGSGPGAISDAGTNGAGTLVAGAVEGSNVDIAAEFTKLIVAQRAYSANTRMVTTADQMLVQTIDMKQ